MNFDTEYLNKLSSLLLRLELCGIKNPLVAGGAIRDMLFERPIKDIDVFYSEGAYTPKPTYYKHLAISEIAEYADSSWKLTHNLQTDLLPDVPIQLIKVKDPMVTIGNFPIDFCRSYYGCINGGPEHLHIPIGVLEDSQNKRTWYDKIECDEAYLERLQEKYYDWEFYY